MQKKGYGIVLAAVICVLTGCGASKTTNIEQGMQLIEESDYDAALESFESAIAYGEDSELLYRGEGIAYMGQGDYESAVSAFLKSLENAGGSVTDLQFDTNYYLASAYYKLGEYEEAEKIYNAIIGLRPKETDAYYLLACTLLKEGYYDAALLDFEKAFALDADNLDLVTSAYEEMEAAGFGEEGKTYIQNMMDAEGSSFSDSQKGVLYYYMGDYDNARIYLDGALNGSDAKLSLILGQTYEQLGDMNYAAVVYQTYLDANTPDASVYNNLGNCLMKQGKYDEALEAFEAGLALGDSASRQSLLFNQVVANEYLGNFDTAKTLLSEYLSVYSDDADAQREAAFLETR